MCLCILMTFNNVLVFDWTSEKKAFVNFFFFFNIDNILNESYQTYVSELIQFVLTHAQKDKYQERRNTLRVRTKKW